MPRDFLLEESSQDKLPGRDFLAGDFPQSKESYGTSLAMAIPRISEDIAHAGMNFIKNIPNYYESAKTEVPGIFSLFKEHPGHASLQALAGSQEAINKLAQFPLNLSRYGTERLNLIPEEFTNAVSKITPEDTTQAINQLFSQPKYPGEELLRGAIRNIPEIYGGTKFLSTFNPMQLTAKSITKDILKTGEKNKKIYNNLYGDFWKQAANQGYGDMSHVPSLIDVSSLKKYSPKKKISGIEDFVNHPTLENAHWAKSDLLAIQRELEKKPTLNSAERKQYKAVVDGINNIQSNMFKDASGAINPEMLNQYNSIQQGFAKEVLPYRNKAINKYKRNEISEKELINRLSKGEFSAKRGQYHKALGIRPWVVPALATAGGASLLKMFYDSLVGNKGYERGNQ